MLTAIIPDPDFKGGQSRTEVYGNTAAELARNVRDHITDNGYGASDIGGTFSIYRSGERVGVIRYNGSVSFFPEEPSPAEKFAREHFYRGAGA